MDIFSLLGRYFWLLGLGATLINTLALARQLQQKSREHPTLAPGYTLLLRGYWVYFSLPWIVMGIGILLGGVTSVWDFFYPRSGNPYVLAWWGIHWLSTGCLSYWVLLGPGAMLLLTHPGLLKTPPQSPQRLKLYFLLLLAGSTLATAIAFSLSPTDAPR